MTLFESPDGDATKNRKHLWVDFQPTPEAPVIHAKVYLLQAPRQTIGGVEYPAAMFGVGVEVADPGRTELPDHTVPHAAATTTGNYRCEVRVGSLVFDVITNTMMPTEPE